MNPASPWWYGWLWRGALPLALLRLWWRGRKEPGYRRNIGERLGRYAALPDGKPVIWIHAVSVGETRAAEPLVARLRDRYPGHRIVLTHMTAAGRATGASLFGDRVTQAYLPYDTTAGATAFLDWCRPRFGLLLETELWPNIIGLATLRRIPLFLVNARMSERSARGYRRFAGTSASMLQRLAGIAAQTEADAERIQSLGAANVVVTGNVKFDAAIPDAAIEHGRRLRAQFGAARPIWMAGSTRDGEEALLLDALEKAEMPRGALLLLVPRHPQRFDVVAALLAQRGIEFVRRSADRPVPAGAKVVLGDSMGEMLTYYAAADIAFVGGTLLPLGGQNLIEPLAVGTPVIIGTSTFNFAEVARDALARGAAWQGADAAAVIGRIGVLLGDPPARTRMREAGLEMLAAHRGATARTLDWIAGRLEVTAGAETGSQPARGATPARG
ncbi:MAG: lipid IV(A) 3-deoxy-D-manno-octulosonic acid transferase [Betaproteobacteria bacterium]